MKDRAWVFVDVDGVLNALGPFDGDRATRWAGMSTKRGRGGWPICYDPDDGKRLLDLADRHDGEVAWLTTWEHKANEHIAPAVGLPQLKVVRLAPTRWDREHIVSSIAEDKATGLEAFLAEHGHRPFVWFDDEPDAQEALGLAGLDWLGDAVWVDPGPGLTTEDIALADELLADRREEGSWSNLTGAA